MVSTAKQGNGKKSKRASVKRPRLTYFYLNGKLHKKLHINRAQDILLTWNFPDGKMVKYNYSDTLNLHKKAFSTKQVCALLNRGRTVVEMAIINGQIESPQFMYSIDEKRKKLAYYWSEEDIMALWEYFASIPQGRPRKDGLVTTSSTLPTRRELRALINDDEILYVKQGDQFVPTFRAKEW